MAKIREIYVCSSCNAQTPQWRGQCPMCREWNTLRTTTQPRNSVARATSGAAPIPLRKVSDDGQKPYHSGIEALDRVLGNGLIPGSALLVGGEPGIGKSTLLLQVAGCVALQGRSALYVTGEESLPQIRARAERLGMLSPNLLALATSRVEDALDAMTSAPPALIIVDSVQTMTATGAEGLPGNVTQVRAVATSLVEAARLSGATLVLVGHVTKDGVLAGPRLLEHMVDTVISLEGDRRQMFRLLRVFKNRFGPNEELLVFHMESGGMRVVDDPSTFFLGARDASLSGTAVVMAVDGRRPLAVEVQALVTRTFLSIPRRTALGFDVNRLHLLLAVLEKRLKINFAQVDIYAKVGGGIRLQEPGLDLALVAALLSSYYDVPLPEKCVLWGEVDLNGQVRPVAAQEQRLMQAKRLGFDPVVHPDKMRGGIPAVAALLQPFFKRYSETTKKPPGR
ncbi:MAG: DNA repair protein RadA/Sms [Candidatus Desulfovibrio kirbyi]|uniref:DNA repair protein RadA n=1 Tax=Candidatus Desulfovibrio kirbyi TaxID=2696086 RepID=A0A6L2R716_9BACT|nr:MAG: DNA repair protein RadA/Sms [Candidatus Desulfovibrio kirbyi]